jgi:hypothetical protein
VADTDTDAPDPEQALAARRRTVLVTAVGAVIAAALLFAVMARVTSTTSTPAGGGGERAARFQLGKATEFARIIARDGPLLLPDPQGRSRDIFIQHLGEANWLAFEARATGAPRQCTLKWEAGPRRFVDPCDGRSYPPDGAGLVSFPTTVNDDGDVEVDLRSPTGP